MSKNFYITTTLPYVNADPHVGFAMEIIHADVIARFKKAQGYDVFFNTGTDEHGQKVYEKALTEKKDPQAYCDLFAARFQDLKKVLNLSEDIHFIRTTDESHKKAAQEFWKLCEKAGDIYKKEYKIRYCVGCELEKTDSELVDGFCPIHPDKPLQITEEENYFFKFSKYGEKLLDLYAKKLDFVIPAYRLNEMKAFIERGLEDFSISRLTKKMSWGVPVPGDPDHVMYVWFDALVNYVSTIGWPHDMKSFEKYWPVVQFAGKDQVRQQAAMWQAMLMSADISPTQTIVIHGFITVDGQKMSKSIGNVINPLDLVNEYGVDVVRYYVCRELNQFEDSDFSMEKFKDAYNAHLANGLGNLVSRIMKMVTLYGVTIELSSSKISENSSLETYEVKKAADEIWTRITSLDAFIQKEEPFKKIKVDKAAAEKDIQYLGRELSSVAHNLLPFMPTTAQTIIDLIKENKMPEKPLFLRK